MHGRHKCPGWWRAVVIMAVGSAVAAGLGAVPAPAAASSEPDLDAAIIDGVVAEPQWGNVPLLLFNNGTDAGSCSSVMITDRWLLTAAHCIAPTMIVAGGSNSFPLDWVDYKAVGFRHPDYDPNEFNWDFGLVRLSEPRPQWGTPIFLPTPDDVAAVVQPGLSVNVLGWGVTSPARTPTDVLRRTTLVTQSVDSCNDRSWAFDPFSTGCARDPSPPSSHTCSGDSGGPLFVDRGGRQVVVGLTSYGSVTCLAATFYALVPAALDWIAATMAADPVVSRIAGDDRYATAELLAGPMLLDDGGTVFVATGENFPDSLAAGPVAVVQGAPIVLVTHDAVPDATAHFLEVVAPSRIVVLGGPAAVSDAVVAELALTGATVDRLWGDTRYETAVALTQSGFPGPVPTVWMASGEDFADALVAAAAAAHARVPLLLANPATGPAPAVVGELARLAPAEVVVVGPASATGLLVEQLQALVPSVRLIGDEDAPARSAAVWADIGPVAQAVLATSLNFPDALTGGVWAAVDPGSALMLVPGTCVPGSVSSRLAQLAPSGVVLLGGPVALSAEVESLTPC